MSTNSTLFSDTNFESVNIPEPILQAIRELGFEKLTQVQNDVLPITLKGGDVVAQAQTGSGKTAAYLLTIFNRLLTIERSTKLTVPRALIVAPTRELAVQISKDAESLSRFTDLKTHVVFGGIDYHKQREILEDGVDLLIGTPGRLIDYHKQGAYSLRQTEILVIDECDRLFDMGFSEDIHWILHQLPRAKDRQSMMFTATLSQRVVTLGYRQMSNPTHVVVNPDTLTPDTIHQELFHVSTREKLSLLLGLLKREGSTRTMIFVNTRFMARRLVEDLQRHGYDAQALTGEVAQLKRLKVLDKFREGRLEILIATDVASRGLHIEGVSHVINYDLPQDAEDYIHRIGRTARVGAEGKAMSLACEEFIYSLDSIHKYIGYEIPVSFADDDLHEEVIPYRPPRRESSQRRPQSRPRQEHSTEGETKAKPKRRRGPRKKPVATTDGAPDNDTPKKDGDSSSQGGDSSDS